MSAADRLLGDTQHDPHNGPTGERSEESYDKVFVGLLTFFSALGGFLFGYDTGVVSGAMVLLTPAFNLNHTEQELVVSLAVAGAFVGTLIGGRIADRYGRRIAIICTSVVFIVASLGLAAATTVAHLMAFRLIIGLAVGAAASTIPVYLAEFAPAPIRGRTVSLYNMAINGGQATAALIDACLVNVEGGWRWMLGLAVLPALLQLPAFLFYFTDTPRWLSSKGRHDEAKAALTRVFGPNPPFHQLNFSPDQAALDQTSFREQAREIFSTAGLRKAVFVGCTLQFVQQASGVNTVMYYTGTILLMAGFSASLAVWLNALVACFNFAFAFLGVFLMDRLGRRQVTFISLSGVGMSLVLIALFFRVAESSQNELLRYMPVAGLSLYLAAFASGMGPIPWTVNSEIYPMQVRSAAVSLATCVNWITNLAVSASFLSLIDEVGRSGAFLLYASVAAAGLVVLYRSLPETKGKTLEEIQQDLH